MQHSLQNRRRLLRACVCATSLSLVIGVSAEALASPAPQARHRQPIVKKSDNPKSSAKILRSNNGGREQRSANVPFCSSLPDVGDDVTEGWRLDDGQRSKRTTHNKPRPTATIVPFSKWRARGVAARFRW